MGENLKKRASKTLGKENVKRKSKDIPKQTNDNNNNSNRAPN